jgi:hypothetical protein
MNFVLRSAALVAAVAFSSQASAAITGDVSGGGSFAGSVSTFDGWFVESAFGDGVDFWTFTVGNAGTVSIDVTSALDFGISVYQGVVGDSFAEELGFNNSASFGDGLFLAGTNALFPTLGSSLLNVALPGAGTYTIALGGDGASGFGIGPFAYTMNVGVSEVPVPAAVWLLGSALAGVAGVARRRAA